MMESKEAQAKFEALKKSAIFFRKEPISKRKQRLKQLLQWVNDHEAEIKDAVYQDFKKPPAEVDLSEIYPVTTEIKHALTHLSDWAKPKKVDAPLGMITTTSHIQYEPIGTTLIISPWNFPFNLAIGPLVSCIAAGCPAIIKPSEFTPNTSMLIQKLVKDLFLPNEYEVQLGGVEASQELLKLPFDHIFFTGSTEVGKIVMKAAADHLAAVTLELGGKSPVIIDESCNLDDAATKIAWGKYMNCGQTCVAPDYILIHHSILDSFATKLKDAVNQQFANTDQDYGRIVSKKHFERLNAMLSDALDQGAELVLGGNADESDNFLPPVILKGVPDGAAVMQEEIFGPILPLVPYKSLDEAIEIINSKPKPLALYYFGENRTNRKQILTETSAGGVCINDSVIQFNHANLPFGGINNSGIGKSHGYHGFMAFSHEKPVLKQRVGFTSSKLVYPPYNDFTKKVIRLVKKFF